MTEVRTSCSLLSRSEEPTGANDSSSSRGYSSDVPTGLETSVTERRGDGQGSWVNADYTPACGHWSSAAPYARGPTSFRAR